MKEEDLGRPCLNKTLVAFVIKQSVKEVEQDLNERKEEEPEARWIYEQS